MFSVRPLSGELSLLELRDESSRGEAMLAPERGGIMTSLTLGGMEVLYMDRATLLDPRKNVRGGNPVLFPTPGKLLNDRWSQAGHAGSLKQHGFARNEAWEVERTSSDEAAVATLLLRSTPSTLQDFPWAFEARYTYALAGTRLRITQRFTNRSTERMPFAAGFHPYFHVKQADKAESRIPTLASQAFDNTTKRVVPLDGPIALTGDEVDLHLLDHGSSRASLITPAFTVTLSASTEFRRWVVWTLADKDFVCLEPWSAPGDAMNTGEALLWLDPGATKELWLDISLTQGALMRQ